MWSHRHPVTLFSSSNFVIVKTQVLRLQDRSRPDDEDSRNDKKILVVREGRAVSCSE